MRGGLVHGARGRRERGTRWLGRDAWRRGLVRAADRGGVPVEAIAGEGVWKGRVRSEKGVRHVGRAAGGLLGRHGPARKEQCDFSFIQNHSNGFELIQ
jgi:hypothetical protein